MKIVTIFAPYLYAIKYSGEKFDELQRLFMEWRDLEHTASFFEEHSNDLEYFNIDIDEAVLETFKETKAFQRNLFQLTKKGNPNLDSIFRNLDNREFRILQLWKQKSKRRWLRLYAIRIDTNVYLITGGAIKLTKTMEERPHTLLELSKLEKCKNYLNDNGVFDSDSFKELLSE